MKKNIIHKATCIILSACMFIPFFGCSNNTQQAESNGTVSSTSTTGTTTTTTTITTTSTTPTTTTTKKSKQRKTKKKTTSTTVTSTDETKSAKNVDGGEKLIALTFDDGPYSPVTERILDTLEKNHAVATFFVVGNRVNSYKASVKRAYDMGCEIGSHTYSHQILTKASVDKMNSEMNQASNAIKNVIGTEATIMRPPGGAVNDTVKKTIKYPLIIWSVDSLDWKNRNAVKNYNNVKNKVFDGCIVLMHDLYPATADAVDKFVPELIKEGYKFVTVDELMELRGVKMQNGKCYYSAKPKETTSATTTTTKETTTTTTKVTSTTTTSD